MAFVRGQEQREGPGEGLCAAFQKTKLVLRKDLFVGINFLWSLLSPELRAKM